MTIPARLHFCWIGPRLPWAYAFAVLSAAQRSELPEIVLHHTDALDDGPALQSLRGEPRVRLHRVDADMFLADIGTQAGLGADLATLYRRLPTPVMQSDVLRAAILYGLGGIYLDLDTLTVASLLPLTQARHFVGSERIVWPQAARLSPAPLCRARHLSLDVMRRALCRLPGGWRTFRRLEHLYVRGVNNAAMGAEAGSPFMAAYLRGMLALSPSRAAQPYALGPHLLHDVVAAYRGGDLELLDPAVFSPFAPEISEHLFRVAPGRGCNAVLPAATRVVHWYASIRTQAAAAEVNPRYVAERRTSQMYSALVHDCLAATRQAA